MVDLLGVPAAGSFCLGWQRFLRWWVVLGPSLDAALSRRRFLGDHQADDRLIELIERSVVRVHERDQDLVRSWGEAVDGIRRAAGIQPTPGCAVDGHMDVADARRRIAGVRTEHRHDPRMLGPVLDDDPSVGQWLGRRWSDDDSCRGLLRERHDRRWPAHLSRGLSPGGGRWQNRRRCGQGIGCSFHGCFPKAFPGS